jgi:hypothetical protein
MKCMKSPLDHEKILPNASGGSIVWRNTCSASRVGKGGRVRDHIVPQGFINLRYITFWLQYVQFRIPPAFAWSKPRPRKAIESPVQAEKQYIDSVIQPRYITRAGLESSRRCLTLNVTSQFLSRRVQPRVLLVIKPFRCAIFHSLYKLFFLEFFCILQFYIFLFQLFLNYCL